MRERLEVLARGDTDRAGRKRSYLRSATEEREERIKKSRERSTSVSVAPPRASAASNGSRLPVWPRRAAVCRYKARSDKQTRR